MTRIEFDPFQMIRLESLEEPRNCGAKSGPEG